MWGEVKEMVQGGRKGSGRDDDQAFYDWVYSAKAMKIAGDVVAAPSDLERCAVLQEDSQWFLDLQRGLLEPQPVSYDEIVRRREAREARLAADPLEAARLGSDVLAFNSIPRISRTPSGTLPGHYVFDIFYIPIPPAADLLFIVQPGSTYSHCEQPIYCHRRPIEEQARAVVPALLRGFTSGLGGGSRLGEGFYPPMAPWDWLTPNEALQVAVELELKRVGVRPELCKVRVSKPEESRIHRECWEECNAAMLRVLGLTELPPEA